MADASGQHLEIFLKLNADAFKEGIRAAVGGVGDLSVSATKGSQDVERTGQALDRAGASGNRYAQQTATNTRQTLSWNAALRATSAMLGTIAGLLGGFSLLGGAVAKMGEAEKAAFNLETSLRAAGREFGDQVGSTASWEDAIGRLSQRLRIYSETDLANAAARTVDMTKRLGLSAEQMEQVVALSGDLAAGKTDLEGAVERVTAALRGEAEASEYLGLTLNENYVKAWHEAHNAHGVAWKDLSDLEKAQVRYRVFLEQALPMQGKAAESVKTWAGALQLIRTTIDDNIGKNEELAKAMRGVAVVLEENSAELGAFAASIATAIGHVIDFVANNRELIGAVVKYGLGFGIAAKAVVSLADGFVKVRTAIGLLAASRLGVWLAELRTAMSTAAASAGLLAAAFRVTLAAAAAYGAVEIGRLIVALYDWKRAEDELARARREAQAQKNWIDPQITGRLAEINRELGTQYRTMDEVIQAQKRGEIAYDETTGAWVRGAADRARASEQSNSAIKKATGDALKEMEQRYREYAQEVRRLQDQIAGRERSLAAELREMARSGMSDVDAYADRKREAQEYFAAAQRAAEEAKQAMEAGDEITGKAKFEEAIALADEAKQAYRDLNTEVKDGDRVIISKADALKSAMDGVKKAGELGIAILKQQQEAAYSSMAKLTEKSGFADLTKGMSEAEQKWLEGWQRMQESGSAAVAVVTTAIVGQQKEISAVESAWASAARSTGNLWVQVADDLKRKIDEATKPRTVTVYTNVVERRSSSGNFADGGIIPGRSPHERADNIGIPMFRFTGGEHVQPVRRVLEYGRAVFEHFRHGRFPRELAQAGLQTNWRRAVLQLPAIRHLLDGAVQALPMPVAVAGGDAGRMVNITITMPSGDSYPMQADSMTAARMEREQERWFALRSSNKVPRSRYARTR